MKIMKKKLVYFLNGLCYLFLTTAFTCMEPFDDYYDWRREEEKIEKHDQRLKLLNADYITNKESLDLVQDYLDSIHSINPLDSVPWPMMPARTLMNEEFFLTNDVRAEWLPFIRVIPEMNGNGVFVVPASRLINDSIATVLYFDSLGYSSWELREVVERTARYLVTSPALESKPMSEWNLDDRREALRLVGINMNWNLIN